VPDTYNWHLKLSSILSVGTKHKAKNLAIFSMVLVVRITSLKYTCFCD